MKKLARILALTLVIVMAFCLVGCGPKSKIKGEWECEIMGQTVTYEFDGEEVKINGEKAGEYEFKGKKLYIDDEEVEYEFDGSKKLTLKQDGLSFELKKK